MRRNTRLRLVFLPILLWCSSRFLCACNLTERETLSNSVCPFCPLCSRFSKVNHGAWHVYKPRFGSSVATCRLACSEISLSIIEKKTREKSRKGRTYYNLADGVTASAQLHTLYSPRARSFNQFQHALYPNFIIIMCNVPKLFNLQDNYLTRNLL